MDNVFNKIFSFIDIDEINSKQKFDEFIINLTNHPAPIREAVAYKLEDLYKDEYLDEKNLKIILSAITDINPNVSRSICKVIKENDALRNLIEEKIILEIKQILTKISDDEKIKNNKNHAKNKILFSLYWLMEALSECISGKFNNEIIEILQSTIYFSDYTIREKTALILTKLNNPPEKLLNMIKNDPNFYVNFYAKLI